MSEAPDRDSRTEEPTEKRIADALMKGQVPFSRELPVLLNGAAIWLVCSLLLGDAAIAIALLLKPLVETPGAWPLANAADAISIVSYGAVGMLTAIAPLVAVLALSGLVGALPQSRGPAFDRIKPSTSRISPAAGWRRLFGRDGLAHAGKSILKLAIVAIVTVWCLKSFEAEALAALDLEAAGLTVLLAAMAARLVGLVALAYIAVAAVDSVLAWRAWRRELRMTRQEQRDEAKEVEGDPAIKHRLRSVARQRARKRMIAAVPRATVVVANPTHFAVALRYLREEGGAPRVVAKGRDLLALKIREVAARHDIPVVEDKALARALHDAVPVDAAIPPEFYKAVARIIMVLSKAGSRLALGAS